MAPLLGFTDIAEHAQGIEIFSSEAFLFKHLAPAVVDHPGSSFTTATSSIKSNITRKC